MRLIQPDKTTGLVRPELGINPAGSNQLLMSTFFDNAPLIEDQDAKELRQKDHVDLLARLQGDGLGIGEASRPQHKRRKGADAFLAETAALLGERGLTTDPERVLRQAVSDARIARLSRCCSAQRFFCRAQSHLHLHVRTKALPPVRTGAP